MSTLLIGPDERKRAQDLVAFAAYAPLTADMLKRFNAGFKPERASVVCQEWSQISEQYMMDLPVGYRVTYTQEQQPPGLMHHLTVSCRTCAPGKLPNPQAMLEIMRLFNLNGGFESVAGMYVEKYASGLHALSMLVPA